MPKALSRYMDGDALTDRLQRGGVASLALKASWAVLNLGVTVLLARTLGADGFGAYSFVLALVSLLAVPAQAGLPHLVVRETARSLSRERWDLVRGVWRWSAGATGLISAFILLLALTVFGAGWVGDGSERGTTLLWGLVLVPFVALGNMAGAAVRGLGRVIRGQLPELIVRPGLLLVLLVGLGLTTVVELRPASAMGIHAVAAALTLLVAWLLLRRSIPPEIDRTRGPTFDGRAWTASAIPLALIAGMHVVNGNTDLIMLGLLTSEVEVGIYRVAVQAASLVTFSLAAVNMIVSPHMARLHTEGDREALQRVVTTAARFALLVALPAALLLIVLGEPLLRLFFGETFGSGALALAVLATGQLVNALFGSVGVLLNMTGHEWDTARGVGIGALANVALNLALIPPLGMLGAALATLATLGIWNLLLWRSVQSRLGLNTLAFAVPGSGPRPPAE